MKLKNLAVGVILAASVAAGTVACAAPSSYQAAYVTGRTMCPDQNGNIGPCVIMSDGDLVSVPMSIWDSIMYGMIYSPYGSGYRWMSAPVSYHIRSYRLTTTTSYASYTRTHGSVRAVSPGTELSQQRSGSTYNSGGSRYTSSPRYRQSAAAAKAARYGSGYSSSKTSYGSKTGYSGTKSGYSSSGGGYRGVSGGYRSSFSKH